jgi:hypothetical protein
MPQPLWEPRALSSPMIVTEEQQTIKKKQKGVKRCHGNRKIQRFRKKCRVKGMKPATIAKQVKKQFNVVENQIGQVTTNDSKVQNNSITVSKNKRKRDLTTNRVVRSTSEQSIVQSPPKKMAKTKHNITTATAATITTMLMIIHNNIY